MDNLLNDLENLFDDVKDQENVYENVPDGEYLAVIDSATYKESKNSGRPMVQIACKIIHGEYEGRFHSRFLMLTGNDEVGTRRNLNAFATQAKKLGVDTSKGFTNTLDQLDELEGKEVVVKIETVPGKDGREWTNTYLNLAED